MCSSKPSALDDLNAILRVRGFRMASFNPEEDLLLPPSGASGDLRAFREILDHYAARLLLREIIKAGSREDWLKGSRRVLRFCDPGAMDDFLRRLEDLGVLIGSPSGYPVPVKAVVSFGPTYEWYASWVLSEDFHCPSLWGVTFEKTNSGGDHDVIASLSGSFLYMEVKTSPPGRIEKNELAAFVRRLIDIAPDLAIFNNDTHLRMKDKIVPMLENEIEKLHGKRGERLHFKHLVRDIFHVGGTIYITNSKPDLRRNLDLIFKHHFRSRNAVLEAITLGDNLIFDKSDF